jgi:hypothetical protein
LPGYTLLTMNDLSDADFARAETLRGLIAAGKLALEILPEGAHPEAEKRLAEDRAELAALLAEVAA